ncbi:hypothetical protein NBRC116584_30350 [Hydrogenophaga sp. 5NK40-0174]
MSLAVLVLAACTRPVDPERMAYVGHWLGPSIFLGISADGYVNYVRKQGATTTKINAPLVEFVGNDFVVGVGPFTTTFVVTEPPHEVGTEWRMTVDGEVLIRQSVPLIQTTDANGRKEEGGKAR